MSWAPFIFGAVSSEEAAKLGTTLTGFGAEKAGNKDGTIPPYTEGLTKSPANFKPRSGVRPDPFAGEKPLLSINAQNMNQYADKLTEGAKALMKRYPTFHTDVYKTHRTIAYPDYVIKNTSKNAATATTYNGGLSVKGAWAGYPFPIPKDGYEVMWNHQLRYMGRASETVYSYYCVDASGKLFLTGEVIAWLDYLFYDEAKSNTNSFWRAKIYYTGPTRRIGEAIQIDDPLNYYEKGRVAYQYLPGQRRVKLAPEVGFDTPSTMSSGATTYDESKIYNGSMERYNFKLIGKKEFYIPYNTYQATYMSKAGDLFGPKHLNPDLLRWELHRMWVVEATLKPGKRHIYAKRVYYVDEDSWAALANENYDAHGVLYKVNFAHQAPSYDLPAGFAEFTVSYNFMNGVYNVEDWPGISVAGKRGFVISAKPRSDREWAPLVLTGQGIR
jgi:hypothetical protein